MKNNELFTRPATNYDTEEIVQMHRELAEYCDYDMERFNISEDKVARAIDNPDSWERYFVAEGELDPGYVALAGMIYVSRSPRSWNGDRGVYVEDLYVKPAFRHGHGVGTALLGEAGDLALQYADGNPDNAFVRLDTARNNNDDTLRFYDGLGFDGYNTNLRLQGDAVKELAQRSLRASAER